MAGPLRNSNIHEINKPDRRRRELVSRFGWDVRNVTDSIPLIKSGTVPTRPQDPTVMPSVYSYLPRQSESCDVKTPWLYAVPQFQTCSGSVAKTNFSPDKSLILVLLLFLCAFSTKLLCYEFYEHFLLLVRVLDFVFVLDKEKKSRYLSNRKEH
jgi:hypothetical protein